MALRLCQEFTKLTISPRVTHYAINPNFIQIRSRMGPPVKQLAGYDQPGLPKPDGSFWRRVLYPEKYTVKPLDVQRLGGRDPVSGRRIVKTVGGGLKYKYHWVENCRVGPKDDSPPLEEKVVQIMDDWVRTAKIALISSGKQIKYYLATENMKPGDIIKTSMFVPRIPVHPNEGDAYPLGALPLGTRVCCVEKYTHNGASLVKAAGGYSTILRKMGDRVVIQLPSKQEYALPKENMCVVGRLSNVHHNKEHIGSPNRLRELGYRPRSGLEQKKGGRFGRRIYALPPVKIVEQDKKEPPEIITMTLNVTARPYKHIVM